MVYSHPEVLCFSDQNPPPHTGEFVDANKELLKSLPPPIEALEYYNGNDMYLFDEFQAQILTIYSTELLVGFKWNRALTFGNAIQTGRAPRSRRPQIRNLYDVFCNIRDDELEHVKTMFQCQTVRARGRERG